MQFTNFFVLATGAHATTVLIANTHIESYEGYDADTYWNTTVWSVDTETGNSQSVANNIIDRQARTAGVVCGDVYYFVWGDSGQGIRAVDLADGTSRDLLTQSRFYELACDPKDASKLLGPASDRSDTPQPFHLKSYDTVTNTETVVGTFPGDKEKVERNNAIFSFTQNGLEVWAAWPRAQCPACSGAKKGGQMHIMDTSSGEIKADSDITFSSLQGTPYLLLPDANRGVFITKGSDDVQGYGIEMQWADLDVADGRIEAKIDGTDASGLWPRYRSAALPSLKSYQMCGSHLFALDRNEPFHVPVLDKIWPADGAIINGVNFGPGYEGETTGLACLLPSTKDFAVV